MKGKNAFIKYALLLLASLALVFNAFAHSGRTDANGGHWNRATGEYHYHTGEYAGRNSSSINSKKTEREQFIPPYVPPPREEPPKDNDSKSILEEVLIWFASAIGVTYFGLLVLGMIGSVVMCICEAIKGDKTARRKIKNAILCILLLAFLYVISNLHFLLSLI